VRPGVVWIERRRPPVRADDLVVLSELLESGKIKPVIDKTVELSDVPAAIRYLEQEHARGKIVVTVGRASTAA
jgi:NADPH:quinone reductase-like Zn-dependent oxidoreductase